MARAARLSGGAALAERDDQGWLGEDGQCWLREVDPSGGCDRYRPRLAELFPCPSALLERHALWQPEGRAWAFDLALFAEARVRDAAHRRLFQEWIARCDHRRLPRPPTGLRELFHLDLEGWLRRADAGAGRLNRLGPALRRRFDGVEQIAALYLRDGTLDEGFFRDAGIDVEEDQQLLRDSFKRALWQEELESETAAARDLFEGWLREVDPSGSLLRPYLGALTDMYDGPEQVVRVYCTDARGAWTAGWSAQFFEDLAVREEHAPLFVAWLRGARASGPGPRLAAGCAAGLSAQPAGAAEPAGARRCEAAMAAATDVHFELVD